MRTVMDDGEEKKIQQIWDHHGSYQWTYFQEGIHKHIDYYLSRRLSGRNLEVGGGWYLHYPNSDVVDISPVCLDYNMAPKDRKYVFDLDDINKGEKLPFPDSTFDSATMISVWQYLRGPTSVVKEMKRILKPGAELYIINGQGAGLEPLVTGYKYSHEVSNFLRGKGYDTRIEGIPDFDGNELHFQSVIAAMPENSNGKYVSKIKEKPSMPSGKRFLQEFANAEVKLFEEKLRELDNYPITKESIEYRKRLDDFTSDYIGDTGNMPLVFADHTIQADFDMMLDIGKSPMIDITVLGGMDRIFDDNERKHLRRNGLDIGVIHHPSYFGTDNINRVEKFETRDRRRLAEFHGAVKLNRCAKEMGEKIEKYLSTDLDGLISMGESTCWSMYSVLRQSKQRRDIDELIQRKKTIEAAPDLVIGRGKLEYKDYLPHLRDILLSDVPRASMD